MSAQKTKPADPAAASLAASVSAAEEVASGPDSAAAVAALKVMQGVKV